MAIATYSKFDTFKEKINSLQSALSEELIISDEFLLEKDDKKKIEIYYAPFEHLNENARLMIVGITPGLHQMKKSFSTVWNAREISIENEEILYEVKKESSFEGSMRKNLIKMLDELTLHSYLGLSSTSELFGSASHLVHTTSVIPYPVFHNGKNYSGSTPKILKNELLRKYAKESLPAEIDRLKNPLIIPLGVKVAEVVDYLAANDYIPANSILHGFPHPSGGNGHRHRQFEENKEKMKKKIGAYFR